MNSLILNYLIAWKFLSYALIFFGLFFEGDIVLFTAAFLTHQGIFDLGDIIVIVFLGTLVGDILWYFAGYYINGKFIKIDNWLNKITKPFNEHILSHPLHTILISKFTFSLGRVIIFRAGSLKLSFKKFLKADLISILLWMIAIGGFGYFTSLSLKLIKHYLHIAEIALIIGLIIFLIIMNIISNRSKKAL